MLYTHLVGLRYLAPNNQQSDDDGVQRSPLATFYATMVITEPVTLILRRYIFQGLCALHLRVYGCSLFAELASRSDDARNPVKQ